MRMYKIKASDSNSKTLFSSLILSSVLINQLGYGTICRNKRHNLAENTQMLKENRAF